MAKQPNQEKQPKMVHDDKVIRERWCGYHGGMVVADRNEFLLHQHNCEIDIAEGYHRKLGFKR